MKNGNQRATLRAKERVFQVGGAGRRLGAMKGLRAFRKNRKEPAKTDDTSKGESAVNQGQRVRLRQVTQQGV